MCYKHISFIFVFLGTGSAMVVEWLAWLPSKQSTRVQFPAIANFVRPSGAGLRYKFLLRQRFKCVTHSIFRTLKFFFYLHLPCKLLSNYFKNVERFTILRVILALLRRGHANLLCIVRILVYVFRMEYIIDTFFHNIG